MVKYQLLKKPLLEIIIKHFSYVSKMSAPDRINIINYPLLLADHF